MIELLVVIAIIAILAAILFPVFAKAREKARTASCSSNCKQMGLAFAQYTNDYDEHYPLGNYAINGADTRWFMFVQPYVKNTQIFVCPSYSGTLPAGWMYGGNAWDNGFQGMSLAAVTRPANKILVLDWLDDISGPPDPAQGGWCFAVDYTIHNGMNNVLFCDGHVKLMNPCEIHSTGSSYGNPGTIVPAATWQSFWYLNQDS